MISKEHLEQRLKDLGWTLYKLAKQFSALRAADGEVSPVTRYHNAIGKAMENPAKSRLETIEGIVQALNGELTIVWEGGRVVTIRLDDEQIAALEERAKTDGKTVTEVAKQLLQLALSGALVQKPKKLTELVIAEEAKIYRSFHPLIASAYSAVHRWLASRPEAEGYKELDYSKDLWRSLESTDLKSIAFQYYTLFPRYYFEAAHVLENVINSTRLLRGLKYNRRICLIDIGCAMGAASAAFIERILTLPQDESISNPIEIVCLGIDPSIYGITLYSKLMQDIKQNVSNFNINLEFQPICDRVPKATITAMRYLQKKRITWEQPVLSNLFIMQLDVASSPNQETILRREQYKKLKELGLEPNLILETEQEFWQEEALGYKQLLEEVPVERLHLLTLGTKNLEKHIQDVTKFTNLSDSIQEINQVIKRVFENSHPVKSILTEEQQVNFKNSVDSYWHDNQNSNYSSKFYAIFHTITSRDIKDDKDWSKLISQANLEVAWVRARKDLLIEALYDEVEIRLFDKNYKQNIQTIIEKLKFYAEDVIPTNQEIPFKFPKGSITTRPKQLSRLEEGILATAIIQTIGKNTGRKFSANRVQKDSDITATEDLYEDWYKLYKEFKEAVEKSAETYLHGAVIRTDIKDYYKTIVRERLLDISKEELKITSKRIHWLLSQIYSRDLSEHKLGIGIKQGTLTSGFYANLYLNNIDDKFSNDKQRIYKFHRYADDMIIILTSNVYIRSVESDLKDKLNTLQLELNQDKTEHYYDVAEFLNTIKNDNEIEELSKEFNITLCQLWIANTDYRYELILAHSSENEEAWWQLIKIYQQCLYAINIYVTNNYLSRKIYQNLFLPDIGREQELNLPPLPSSDNFSVISNWARSFEKLAAEWLQKKNNLKNEIYKFFYESLQELLKVTSQLEKADISMGDQEKRSLLVHRRKLETRVRFAINKLAILGFNEVWQEIVNLICSNLYYITIRHLLDNIISLARQGYTDAIKQLREYYQNSEQETSKYIRAVLLEALRFLPSIDVQDWESIVELSVSGKSDIERLKATETWLYLGNTYKHFVQPKHIQAIVNALNSDSEPFLRLKKNYILILGIHHPEAISDISITPEESDDYLICDAFKLALEGKVSELFKQDEPTVVRQYYKVKRATTDEYEDEEYYSQEY